MAYDEADTRAMLIDPALHARNWAERVGEAECADHGEFHPEQSAVLIDIIEQPPQRILAFAFASG